MYTYFLSNSLFRGRVPTEIVDSPLFLARVPSYLPRLVAASSSSAVSPLVRGPPPRRRGYSSRRRRPALYLFFIPGEAARPRSRSEKPDRHFHRENLAARCTMGRRTTPAVSFPFPPPLSHRFFFVFLFFAPPFSLFRAAHGRREARYSLQRSGKLPAVDFQSPVSESVAGGIKIADIANRT